MQTEPFDFTTPDGRHVNAVLDRPSGQARGFALFAHCFTCGKDNLAATRISRALANEGVGTLRIDFAGAGDRSAAVGFTSDVEDLVAAGEHMTRKGCAPGLLIGHSLGGAAAIAAAGRMPTVKAVATIGAPFDVTRMKVVDGAIQIGGKDFPVEHGFAEDLWQQDQRGRLETLKRALLILHSPVDQVVDVEEATGIYVAAKHPKSFVSLDKADHLLSRAEDAVYAASVIAAWASRYIEDMTTPMGGAEADGVVRVAETGAGRFQVKIEAGGAVILGDEPVSVGGMASGPTPYELVGAGLGACTAMTLRLYAERKGLPLERVSVEVRHEKRAGETPPDVFERTLTLDGLLSEEQRARMFEIADKCPVHRTLEGSSRIVTRAKAAMAAPDEAEHFAEMEMVTEERAPD